MLPDDFCAQIEKLGLHAEVEIEQTFSFQGDDVIYSRLYDITVIVLDSAVAQRFHAERLSAKGVRMWLEGTFEELKEFFDGMPNVPEDYRERNRPPNIYTPS